MIRQGYDARFRRSSCDHASCPGGWGKVRSIDLAVTLHQYLVRGASSCTADQIFEEDRSILAADVSGDDGASRQFSICHPDKSDDDRIVTDGHCNHAWT